jgi:hypothetical protein
LYRVINRRLAPSAKASIIGDGAVLWRMAFAPTATAAVRLRSQS